MKDTSVPLTPGAGGCDLLHQLSPPAFPRRFSWHTPAPHTLTPALSCAPCAAAAKGMALTLQLGSLLSIQPFPEAGTAAGYTGGNTGTNSTLEDGENPTTGE